MEIKISENPYKVLGIERNATPEEIKQAYFALVREHPPETDPEGFKRIRAAYERLRAAKDRAQTEVFIIDDTTLTLNASSLQKSEAGLPALTPAQITADLIVVEAIAVLEELRLRDLS